MSLTALQPLAGLAFGLAASGLLAMRDGRSSGAIQITQAVLSGLLLWHPADATAAANALYGPGPGALEVWHTVVVGLILFASTVIYTVRRVARIRGVGPLWLRESSAPR